MDLGEPCERVARLSTHIPISISGLSKLERLHLSVATLAGNLPHDFGRLTALQHLYIHTFQTSGRSSKFTGLIGRSFWNLHELRTLYFEYTSLTNFEAPGGDQLPFLEELSFSKSTQFEGNLTLIIANSKKLRIVDLTAAPVVLDQPSFDDLPSLEVLHLQEVLFEWLILDSFWRTCLNLTSFDARSALKIGGSFSEDIGRMKYLSNLALALTSVQGSIPRSIGRCPLKVLNLSKTQMSMPIPRTIGQLNATLEYLDLSYMTGLRTTLPDEIGDLHKLRTLSLRSCRLQGTIPARLSKASNLSSISLDNNLLTGPLPDFEGSDPIWMDIHDNLLSGTIPSSLGARCSQLRVGYNNFEGTIPSDFFLGNVFLSDISLTHNRFSGTLPLFDPGADLQVLQLDFNEFEGTVPASYCNVTKISLSHNKLSGSLSSFLQPGCHFVIDELDLSHNNFTGSFPDVDHLTYLTDLYIGGNNFSGPLPLLPKGVLTFDANNNQFDPTNVETWVDTPGALSLEYLDLSKNYFRIAHPYTMLIGPNLTYLSVAYNRFDFQSHLTVRVYPLTGLDLTSTHQEGIFPAHNFPKLVLLKLSNNRFSGSLLVSWLSSVTLLDISYNQFEFEISILSRLSYLTYLNARDNQIYGSLVLTNLPNLQTADISANSLDYSIDLASIGEMFSKNQLQLLNISRNIFLPTIDSLDTENTGLNRSTLSSPSVNRPDLKCYELAFYNRTGYVFSFDEDLFNYIQCDCDAQHFGAPKKCVQCPKSGIASCGGSHAVILENSFAIVVQQSESMGPKPQDAVSYDAGDISSEDASNSFFGPLLLYFGFPKPAMSSSFDRQAVKPNSSPAVVLDTESCLVRTIQTLSGKSNCQSIRVTVDDLIAPNVTHFGLDQQCQHGSEGRLCSRCSCNMNGSGECWYQSGPICSKCRHVFNLPSAVALLVGGILLTVAVMSLVFTVVLRRKRSQSLESFDKLPLWKRIFYRTLYLTSLGNVAILVGFLQILVEFTQWDAYAKVEILGIINGEASGYGNHF